MTSTTRHHERLVRWARFVSTGLVALAAACAQPGGGGRPAAGPPPTPAVDARAIDAAAAAIQAGQHQPIPAPQALSRDVAGSVSEVRSANETAHRLELLYSGPTSQRLVLEPGARGEVRLQPGRYLVTARVTDPSARILPFAGARQLDAGVYGSRWVISTPAGSAAADPLAGKGLPLDPTARQVRDWIARVHKSPQMRQSYTDGGRGIEQFMGSVSEGGRALFIAGGGGTQSGRCALLAVHAGEVFGFDAPATSDAPEACRSDNLVTYFGGARSRVVRGAQLGSIQSFSVRSADHVDPTRPLVAEFRLWLDVLPPEPLALRLTVNLGRSTMVMRSPPLTLRRGENLIRHDFGPLRSVTSVPGLNSGDDAARGPVVVVSDLTYADNARANQLLGRSAAALINVGS